MTWWQYLVLETPLIPPGETQAWLQKLGDEGWELVSLHANWFYFKRQRP